MIPPFNRANTYEFPAFTNFPLTGHKDFLYRDVSENKYYVWNGSHYQLWLSSGHEILDDGGKAKPQRPQLQFLSSNVVDDPVKERTTVEFALDMTRPFRPTGISPANGSTDLDLMVRLVATPYAHPLMASFPVGGSRWQVATDSDFTTIVFDSRIISTTDSIVVSTDSMSQPYLEVGTTYYWRMSYFDIRDHSSEWSPVLSFSTSSVATGMSILQPHFTFPVNEGNIPDYGFFAKLSAPVVLGPVVVDGAALQVSTTPNFAPSDILLDIVGNDHPMFFTDDADFRTAPDIAYLRGRQTSSVSGIASTWSTVPMVWFRRAFGDFVIGIAIHTDGVNTYSTRIDRHGNPIHATTRYFDSHPIWGGMTETMLRINNVNTTTAGFMMGIRIPRFYCNAETIDHGTTIEHRIWASPVPFDGGVGYAHPAMITNPHGFLYSTRILATTFNTHMAPLADLDNITVASPNTGTNNMATWTTQRNLGREVVGNGLNFTNIHTDNAVRILRLIEVGYLNQGDNPLPYRGIELNFKGASMNCDTRGLDIVGGSTTTDGVRLRLSNPASPEAPTFVDYPITNPPNLNQVTNIAKIATGYDSNIMAHRELYGIPAEFGRGNDPAAPYWSTIGNSSEFGTHVDGTVTVIRGASAFRGNGIFPQVIRTTGGGRAMRGIYRL